MNKFITHFGGKLTYRTSGLTEYNVFWEQGLNGGGTYFGTEYPEVIKTLYPNHTFNRCLEWCSGPGFIGFNIMSHNLCKNLTLVDLYQPALNKVKETIEYNNLQEKVDFYKSSTIKDLKSTHKFDLIVANPPHYDKRSDDGNDSRILDDVDWEIHKEFYENIGFHMADECVILIQENEDGSKPEYFYNMIEKNNLKLFDVIKSPNQYDNHIHTKIYYLQLVKNINNE
jgi:methylase of polypeptide subunit release factors